MEILALHTRAHTHTHTHKIYMLSIDGPEIVASNSSSHDIMLGEMLRLQCSYNGVPVPIVQWFHNNLLLMDRSDGIIINMDHNITSILKDEAELTSGGMYTCRATSSIGFDQESYSVRILSKLNHHWSTYLLNCYGLLNLLYAPLYTVLPDPVTNLVVSSVGEREVSLSWLTGYTEMFPISAIEIDVFPSMGAPFRRVIGNVNMTTVIGLMPFREYRFSITVINVVGRSETVNITASTLSLGIKF